MRSERPEPGRLVWVGSAGDVGSAGGGADGHRRFGEVLGAKKFSKQRKLKLL